MRIETLTLGHVQTNTYFIETNQGWIVVDPCIATPRDYDAVMALVKDTPIRAILLTHGHFDHISGVDILANASTPVYISAKDAPFLSDERLNGSSLMGEVLHIQTQPTILEGDTVTVDNLSFKVIQTPGHTHGSVSYLLNHDCFVGDFIMDGSIGRTDLVTGSMLTMRNALTQFKKRFGQKKITLYPGHGSISTLEHELLVNPYLRQL